MECRVPAVLALAGRGAWYLPRWPDRLLPNLDVEGAALRPRYQRPARPEMARELG